MNSTISKHSILLVEDDHDIAHVLCFVLRRAGHQVTHVASGRAAIELLDREAPPDLFILDLVMPEMDGLELLRWLRSDKGLNQPMLVLTGTIERGLDERLKEAGANAVAHKPIDMQAIGQLIDGLLS
jgi:CheY-like chemotaxis protein